MTTAVASAAGILSAGPLADALERHRAAFNARFARAAVAGSRVDSAAFLEHLRVVVDPIVRGIAEVFAERADGAAVALYELSLALFSASLLGPGARHAAIGAVWQRLLPAIPRLMAREPRRMAASLSNAAHTLGQAHSARPAQWVDVMCAIGPACNDGALFLDQGKIAAWQAGCPHYRGTALEVARRLPAEALAGALFPRNTAAQDVARGVAALAANRWLTPAEALMGADPRRVRIVQRCGDFRGFAGPFLRPPTVSTQGPQLIASDGETIWSIIADATGCLFHRMAEGTVPANKQTGITKLSPGGDLRWESAGASFPELANASSAAFDGQTLAVTLADSYHVVLVGRG